MRSYLDGMLTATPSGRPWLVLARSARSGQAPLPLLRRGNLCGVVRARGGHPYFVPAEHTRKARLVNPIVGWGDADAIDRRVREHLDGGADHVCIQPLDSSGGIGLPAPR